MVDHKASIIKQLTILLNDKKAKKETFRIRAYGNALQAIKEYEGELIFLHKIVDGFSNHSFGIKVAKLAGIPEKVTDRALDILKVLENNSEFNRNKNGAAQNIPQTQDKMSLNTIDQPQIRDLLQSLNVDDLSPKEALHFLYKIQRELKQ